MKAHKEQLSGPLWSGSWPCRHRRVSRNARATATCHGSASRRRPRGATARCAGSAERPADRPLAAESERLDREIGSAAPLLPRRGSHGLVPTVDQRGKQRGTRVSRQRFWGGWPATTAAPRPGRCRRAGSGAAAGLRVGHGTSDSAPAQRSIGRRSARSNSLRTAVPAVSSMSAAERSDCGGRRDSGQSRDRIAQRGQRSQDVGDLRQGTRAVSRSNGRTAPLSARRQAGWARRRSRAAPAGFSNTSARLPRAGREH